MVNLRERKNRPSYSYLFDLGLSEEEEHNGSDGETVKKKKKLPAIEEPVSDSEFDPEDAAANDGEGGDNSDSDSDALEPDPEDDADLGGGGDSGGGSDDNGVLDFTIIRKRYGPNPSARSTKSSSTSKFSSGPVTGVATLNFTQKRPGNRTPAAFLNAYASSRTRPVPLFIPGPVSQRLLQPPSPFQVPLLKTTPALEGRRLERVSKAWKNSLYSGPTWEIIEDIGWYKELLVGASGERVRPVVYGGFKISSDNFEILSREEALPYLPSDKVTNSDGSYKSPPPVDCLLGPFGGQESVKFEIFQHRRTSDFISNSTGHVFNAGGPVWGLDWCPVSEQKINERNFVQYLAVSTFPTSVYSPVVTSKSPRPSPASIQVWSYGPGQSPQKSPSKKSSDNEGSGDAAAAQVNCELVICIESGPALELKWCPLPAHDKKDPNQGLGKIGFLGGVFADGSVTIFAVPDPKSLEASRAPGVDGPLFVRISKPVIRIELDDCACTSLDWANSELLAIGCSNGSIAVYDLKETLSRNSTETIVDLLPMHIIAVPKVAIRSIAWIRVPTTNTKGDIDESLDPTIIAAVAYDGSMTVVDIRDPFGNLMSRARDVSFDIAFGPYSGGPLSAEHENFVKAYCFAPAALGRGSMITETKGPVWSISASDYHPYLATGAADGSCSTSNLLKAMRKGSSAPPLVHKIFQMDYNRKTGQFRMLENFLPLELVDRSSGTKAKKKKKIAARQEEEEARKEARMRDGSGAWPPEVGIHRVAWHSGAGYGCAPLLASGMASGLCRIDFLKGRFYQDRVPYGDVAVLRGENEGVNMMDDEDEDDE